jgi:hypothetical protein
VKEETVCVPPMVGQWGSRVEAGRTTRLVKLFLVGRHLVEASVCVPPIGVQLNSLFGPMSTQKST